MGMRERGMRERDERQKMHDASVSVLDDALVHLARCAGEEEIGMTRKTQGG
jgi:hypothetical protein